MGQVRVNESAARTSGPAQSQAQAEADSPTGQRRPAWRSEVRAALTVAVLVAAFAMIPLWRNRLFYYWDDTAATFMPHWYRIGEALRHGHWPVLWPDMWMGGNLTAESMLGLWNPVVLANAVGISFVPDLAVAAILLKTEFMVVLAVGVYLLAREYGAARRAAAVVGIAMPFAGFTLWHDASAWIAGLMAYAFVPYFWVAARRHLRGRLNPVVPFVFGYVTMTVGTPAGAVAFIVVVAALALERLLTRDVKAVVRLAVVAAAVGLSAFVVFLPVRATVSAVSWRSTETVGGGWLVPRLGDFLNLSSPTYLPSIPHWLTSMSTPISYLAWFMVPLAPWLSWSTLRRLRGENVGPVAFGAGAALLSLLPANLWLFRYPVRFTDYLYLALGVCFALMLGSGLRIDRWRVRAAGTAAIVAVQAYLAWAVRPHPARWHATAALVVAVLLAAAVLAARSRPRLLPAVLAGGTAVVLALQVSYFPANFNLFGWRLPHNVAQLRAQFSDRYQGNLLQLSPVPPYPDMQPKRAWRDLLMGNLYPIAGVTSVNSYTGIGFHAFSDPLCMDYASQSTCSDQYDRVWRGDASTGQPLVDLLRVNTLVVARKAIGGRDIDTSPAGWQITERTSYVTVLKRVTPLPWPDGRVAWNDPGVTVLADTARPGPSDPGEDIRYRGGGRITIAMLAWPGWRASVDGRAVPVSVGPAGLVQITVPDAGSDGAAVHLNFEPPGLRLGEILLVVGLALGIGYGLVAALRRRTVARRQENA